MIIVKCPNCKTKFSREVAQEEFCGVCETTQLFKEVKEKKVMGCKKGKGGKKK